MALSSMMASTRNRGAARPAGADSGMTLRAFVRRNSCLRQPDPRRLRHREGEYKKGWELRIILESNEELARVRRLLRAAGLEPARPFAKRRQWIQPVYGRDAVLMVTGQKASASR